MKNRIVTIARYSVLEAMRTRLLLLTAVMVAILLGASFFVREIAITDSTRFQVAFYAAAARFAAVFVAALYVIASMTREFHDKGLDAVLALDLPRSHYILGKLAGFLAIALVLAVVVALPLVPLAGWLPVAQWTASLAFELAIVVALSLFCVVTFNQLMPAASFVLAFYVLARGLTAIRLISASPVSGAHTPSHEAMRWLTEGIALVMPALDGWTRTSWLVDQAASWSAILTILGQSAVYVTLLAAAAVFDFQRRNF